MRNDKKGFTLIEILLVITIMAILAIAAMSSSITIQRYYIFKNNFAEIITKVQQARLYSITQKVSPLATNSGSCEFNDASKGIPLAYGVNVQKEGSDYSITLFADLESSAYQNAYNDSSNCDTSSGTPKPDYELSKYVLNGEKYEMKICENNCTCTMANDGLITDFGGTSYLNLIYATTSGKILITKVDTAGPSSIEPDQYACIVVKEVSGNYSKNIVIFPKSGIAEDINPEDYVNPTSK